MCGTTMRKRKGRGASEETVVIEGYTLPIARRSMLSHKRKRPCRDREHLASWEHRNRMRLPTEYVYPACWYEVTSRVAAHDATRLPSWTRPRSRRPRTLGKLLSVRLSAGNSYARSYATGLRTPSSTISSTWGQHRRSSPALTLPLIHGLQRVFNVTEDPGMET